MIVIPTVSLVALITFVLLGVNWSESIKNNTFRFTLKRRQLFAFLSLLVVIPFLIARVDANQVGIVYDPLSGGIQDYSLDEGYHIKAPWIEVYNIRTSLREENFEVTAQTGRIFDEDGTDRGGGQWATYEVTLQYRVQVDFAHRFYRNFGGDAPNIQTIEARVRAALQETSSQHNIFDILKGDLILVRAAAQDLLVDSMLELGITVESFIIRDVDAGVSIENVVQDEAIAAKQREIAEKEQEAQLVRENTEKLSQEIRAEALIIRATAEAEAEALLASVTINAINVMYAGQFEDDADRTSFETTGEGGYLTIQEVADIVLTQLYYDTWDGKLPEVIASEDGLSLILPNRD